MKIQNNLPRKLQATWTVELQQGDIEFSEGGEEECAKILQAEIDWEVLCDIMMGFGWKKVEIDFIKAQSVEVLDWLTKNCKHKYHQRGQTYLFEDEKEYEWFVLR